MRLILASASPRRAELLRAAGFEFDIVVPEVDERPRAGEQPAAYVRRLASDKSAAALAARAVSDGRIEEIVETVVLGADTAVVIDGEILGKPRDDREAAAMIRRLSGRWHQVMTGVSVRRKGRTPASIEAAIKAGAVGDMGADATAVEVTAVEFAQLSAAEVAWYVASGEGRDKAGAYAIQGGASRFIARINGSYSNVVGLPITCVVRLLQEIRQLES